KIKNACYAASGASRARALVTSLTAPLEDFLMSLRPLAVCAVVISLAGCYKQEQVNAVQHRAGWQREAGQSTVAAANVFKQSESNSEKLAQAMQSGNSQDLLSLQGKLVKLDAELTDQTSSTWTLRKDG